MSIERHTSGFCQSASVSADVPVWITHHCWNLTAWIQHPSPWTSDKKITTFHFSASRPLLYTPRSPHTLSPPTPTPRSHSVFPHGWPSSAMSQRMGGCAAAWQAVRGMQESWEHVVTGTGWQWVEEEVKREGGGGSVNLRSSPHCGSEGTGLGLATKSKRYKKTDVGRSKKNSDLLLVFIPGHKNNHCHTQLEITRQQVTWQPVPITQSSSNTMPANQHATFIDPQLHTSWGNQSNFENGTTQPRKAWFHQVPVQSKQWFLMYNTRGGEKRSNTIMFKVKTFDWEN